jgi:hypothetical protein
MNTEPRRVSTVRACRHVAQSPAGATGRWTDSVKALPARILPSASNWALS